MSCEPSSPVAARARRGRAWKNTPGIGASCGRSTVAVAVVVGNRRDRHEVVRLHARAVQRGVDRRRDRCRRATCMQLLDLGQALRDAVGLEADRHDRLRSRRASIRRRRGSARASATVRCEREVLAGVEAGIEIGRLPRDAPDRLPSSPCFTRTRCRVPSHSNGPKPARSTRAWYVAVAPPPRASRTRLGPRVARAAARRADVHQRRRGRRRGRAGGAGRGATPSSRASPRRPRVQERVDLVRAAARAGPEPASPASTRTARRRRRARSRRADDQAREAARAGAGAWSRR